MRVYINGMRCGVLTLYLCAATVFLSGCLPSRLFFSENTNYQIEGLEELEEPRIYLQSVLDERLEENISADKSAEEEYARAESYREEMIAADLAKAMRAQGYYEAKVEYRDDKTQSLTGTYHVQAGPLYTLASVTTEPENLQEKFDVTLIETGKPLEAEAVLRAQNNLLNTLQKDRCYFSLEVGHAVFLDEEDKTAELKFIVERGPEAVFGATTFEGQDSVKTSYLNKLVPWKEGDCFRREQIEALKTKLLETGLFARAESKVPATPVEDGSVPVTISLKERAQRSVKAGLNYYTDTGPGARLSWEHRNIFGAAEKLQANLDINQIEQELSADFTKPFFMRKDQNLNANASLGLEDTDAYEATNFDIGANISRQFTDHLSGSVGTAFSVSEIDNRQDTQVFGLVSLPASLTYDNRDNALDPHKGWLLTGGVEPFFDAFGESEPFTTLQAGARTYVDLADDPDLVLALRANTGSLIGDDSADIPATQRFYAGGGGSVRGFGYQEVGPFENGEPAGGRSFVTGSTELRVKLANDFGAAAFLDAGSVSESTTPDLDNLSFGAGVGVRYFTGFGPLRFDVAVPLNRRDETDESYQFYISIGQAF